MPQRLNCRLLLCFMQINSGVVSDIGRPSALIAITDIRSVWILNRGILKGNLNITSQV